MIGDPFRDTEQYKLYGILLARIDDRLVHGQVVVGWSRAVDARYIVVCNDRTAGDEFSKTIIETASAPADMSVKVLTVEEAVKEALPGAFRKTGAIFLFENPADLLKMMDAGVKLDKVNLGGLHQKPGKTEATKAIWLDENDCADLQAIVDRGARVTVQMVPTEAEVGIETILKKMAVSTDG